MNGEALTIGWQRVSCDLCGSHAATSVLLANSCTLAKCIGCGLVFVNPRPAPEIISEYYSDSYYAHGGMAARAGTVKGRVRSRLVEALGAYNEGSIADRMIRTIARPGVVDIVIPSHRRGRLLDVGSGDGERVRWYAERGFEAEGVELSERAARNARGAGINVRQGTLLDAGYPDCSFDVVLMAHVLEHTHSPSHYLKESFRILRPGGLLAVAVPNIESHNADLYGKDWGLLMLPIHLYHFSVNTLTKYLLISGFEIDEFVGKTIYPSMVRVSQRAVRRELGLAAFMGVWSKTGVVASSLQRLRYGLRKCDAITAYCTKPFRRL